MADKEPNIREIAADPALLQQFIIEQESFILACASGHAGRRIDKSDDEWSVALEGFLKAIDRYDAQRGDFKSFAGVVVRNGLTDYYRQTNKTAVGVSPKPLDEMPGSTDETAEIRLEIHCLANILKTYGITFKDLANTSPKAAKTKKACAQAVRVLLDNRELRDALKAKKQLPMGRLVEQSGIPAKILERHRQYIIAVVELIDNEFDYLADYAKTIWR